MTVHNYLLDKYRQYLGDNQSGDVHNRGKLPYLQWLEMELCNLHAILAASATSLPDGTLYVSAQTHDQTIAGIIAYPEYITTTMPNIEFVGLDYGITSDTDGKRNVDGGDD